jgi:putative PEP-CTERM system histidine kinase
VNLFTILPFAAAVVSMLLACAALLRKKPTPASWCFSAGMIALGIDSLFNGLALGGTQAERLDVWLTRGLLARSFVPMTWLCFSVTYSRGHYRQVLRRWSGPLAILSALPIVVLLAGPDQLIQLIAPDATEEPWELRFGTIAKTVNGLLLVSLVLILMNLEQTFRAAVGAMRWRIKFVIVGLVVIFATRIYIHSQAILYSSPDVALSGLSSAALLLGCVFLLIAYVRAGWAEIDVYPSQAVMRSSVTVVVAGGYLLVVGILAQAVRRFGGAEIFQFQAVVVLVGLAGLVVLLLSDRMRQRIHAFAVRHFRKAQHDSVGVWTLFSQRLSLVTDHAAACAAAVGSIAETFDVLSVTIWMTDQDKGQLTVAASTAKERDAESLGRPLTTSTVVLAGLEHRRMPFDLEHEEEAWAAEFRVLNPPAFEAGGDRWCVPLYASDRHIGAMVLADRVGGVSYTVEELELLTCIGRQVTSVLLNLRLADEVAQARELEAFRLMSAFFIHDLKNAAASLNLTLQNLPVHFDDPAFRADALRVVGNTAKRIDDMIVRLSAFRQRPSVAHLETDLNHIVATAVDRIEPAPNVALMKELRDVPRLRVDREQIQSVVTNLVLNAQEALGTTGRVLVRTEHRDGQVILSVSDNGCGMTPAFVKESLFRPFQSTKKKGLGIGLFQSKTIIQAHGGRLQVESEPGKGTTFQVCFPAKGAQ